MSTRASRLRAEGGEDAQTSVKDYFKTTRKPTRVRGEKKLIDDVVLPTKTTKTRVKKEEAVPVSVENVPVAPIFEKPSRTRTRTPSRQADLEVPELTGTPPKKLKEPVEVAEKPSAIDELINAVPAAKPKGKIRTVASLQARLAEKGSAKSIHAQNLKNKSKKVEEHAEVLKSPLKKVVPEAVSSSPTKKARRALGAPKIKENVPEYVLPPSSTVLLKSAEKIREEADQAHDLEVNRRTIEFLKTSRLVEDVKESVKSDFALPLAYEHLANAFQHVDRIVSIINSQHRSVVAAELFKNVKNTSQKDFSEHHLSQILHVYPQSYHVEMREQWKAFGGVQSGKYELEVKANLVDDLKGFLILDDLPNENEDVPLVRPGKLMASPMKSPRKGGPSLPVLRKPEIDCRKRLDAARMRDRSHVFRYKLIEIVKQHYAKFLEEEGIPNSTKLVRMHPLFSLNKHCPPLEKKKLPEAPIVKNTTHVGMREYMDLNLEQKVAELPKFVEKAFNDLKSPLKSTTGTSGQVPLSPKKFAEMQADQKKKGGMSLLERIRAKEACRKAAEACVDDDLKIRKSRLTLLDSRYLRTLCCLYATKKLQSMEMDVLAEKLVFSTQIPTSKADVIAHVELLCDVAKNYMMKANVMGKRYLRITDNNYDAIAELVRDELHKAKSATDEQARKMEEAHKVAMMATPPHAPRPPVSKASRALKFA